MVVLSEEEYVSKEYKNVTSDFAAGTIVNCLKNGKNCNVVIFGAGGTSDYTTAMCKEISVHCPQVEVMRDDIITSEQYWKEGALVGALVGGAVRRLLLFTVFICVITCAYIGAFCGYFLPFFHQIFIFFYISN